MVKIAISVEMRFKEIEFKKKKKGLKKKIIMDLILKIFGK